MVLFIFNNLEVEEVTLYLSRSDLEVNKIHYLMNCLKYTIIIVYLIIYTYLEVKEVSE